MKDHRRQLKWIIIELFPLFKKNNFTSQGQAHHCNHVFMIGEGVYNKIQNADYKNRKAGKDFFLERACTVLEKILWTDDFTRIMEREKYGGQKRVII